MQTVVNVILDDGTYLKEALIFHTGETGEFPIQDKEIINNKFSQKAVKKENFIAFQTTTQCFKI